MTDKQLDDLVMTVPGGVECAAQLRKAFARFVEWYGVGYDNEVPTNQELVQVFLTFAKKELERLN